LQIVNDLQKEMKQVFDKLGANGSDVSRLRREFKEDPKYSQMVGFDPERALSMRKLHVLHFQEPIQRGNALLLELKTFVYDLGEITARKSTKDLRMILKQFGIH
jgi:hypothetical protein